MGGVNGDEGDVRKCLPRSYVFLCRWIEGDGSDQSGGWGWEYFFLISTVIFCLLRPCLYFLLFLVSLLVWMTFMTFSLT